MAAWCQLPPALTLPLQGGGDKGNGPNNNSPLPWREGVRGRGTHVKFLMVRLSKHEGLNSVRGRS
jgi:hypothetical protein